MLSFSGVTFFSVFVSFSSFSFTGAAALRSIVLRSSLYVRPDSHTLLPNNCLPPFSFFCFLFLFLFCRCHFFRVILCTTTVVFVVWRVRRTFPLSG